MRLNSQTIARLPADIARFAYDRTGQSIGIVHFGIGAFHRAHMASYTDLAMNAGERDWMISGVSLRSRSVAERLNPQEGLFTLTERAGDNASTRLVGSVAEVLYAPDQADEVISRIADPACQIVSFTVTEKGYARREGNLLNLQLAEASFYPLLSSALERRRKKGLPGVTLLSCDNLPDNGRVLRTLFAQWLAARNPDMIEWFQAHCSVPSTMIDRIVPRTDEQDLAWLEGLIGMQDPGAVFTERFSQWVIEDDFAGRRPAWENHGAQLVEDVRSYETAKLRMLNGAHSMIAYCGLQAGYEFVHEAVADPILRRKAERLMREEALPTISPAEGQDLEAYADTLMERFADPALRHRLSQIAMDGTQKIPQRWLDTLVDLEEAGGVPEAIPTGIDAWLWHIEDRRFVDDPRKVELHEALLQDGREAVLSLCFLGHNANAAIWPGYTELLPRLVMLTDGR
ncbi:mannitol dehydrogenase family protein [Erythrobacteraceae bacterium WH01K]|nr:mannitol dehydrogenase family protein [Erythrobacteraceae bacterium WH01K]